VSSAGKSVSISQKKFNDAIAEMLVEDMEPVAIVERTGFTKFCKIVAPYCDIPSRKTLVRIIESSYASSKSQLVETLSNIKWMSATADIWSAHKRAFMGVTLHYVDPQSLKIQSIALACRRFRDSHTAEAIAKMLRKILDEFAVTDNIVNVVTDNAANFAKAFTLVEVDTQMQAQIGAGSEMVNEPSEYEDAADVDEACSLADVADVLQGLDDECEDGLVLPPHKRCGNHTLNLVTSVDALNARRDSIQYKRLYDRAMAKVVALSTAVSRSPKNADLVEEVTGSTFLKPTVTRWCSDFYAVERVVDIGFEKVKECQRKLDQATFSESDFSFLQAYMRVMKPVVSAMDILQSENSYIGHVVPTIFGLQRKLTAVSDRSVKPLAEALVRGLEARFGSVIESDEYCLASALIPQFKLNFLPEERKPTMKRKLLAYIEDVLAEQTASGMSSLVSFCLVLSAERCVIIIFFFYQIQPH